MAGNPYWARMPYVVLLVVALATASCSASSVATASPSSASRAKTAEPSPTASPSSPPPSRVVTGQPSGAPHPASKNVGPGPVHVIARFEGAPAGLATSPDGSIYDAHSVHQNANPIQVIRYVPGQGVTATSARLPGRSLYGSRLAFAGGAVWVLSDQGAAGSAAYRLDPVSLAVLSKVALPNVATAIAAAPSGLWVSSGHDLLRLDPVSGGITAQVPLTGHVTNIAANPSGDLLYVSTDAPMLPKDRVPLYELSAWTGTVLRRTGAGTADLRGVGSLAATDTGVWTTSATGMSGVLAFFRAGDLHRLAIGEGVGVGTNAVKVAAAGGAVWRTDAGGRSLICVNQTTGGNIALRSTSVPPAPPFAVTPTGLYAATWAGLARITPPPACG